MSMTSEGLRVRRVVASAEDMERAEKLCPGYRMMAGPFNVTSRWKERALEEQREAAKILLEARAAGLDCKLVTLKGMAYVMRTVKGYVDADVSRKFQAGQVRGVRVDVKAGRRVNQEGARL